MSYMPGGLNKTTRWQYIEAMAEAVNEIVHCHKLNREKLEKKLGGKVEQLLPEIEIETISTKGV